MMCFNLRVKSTDVCDLKTNKHQVVIAKQQDCRVWVLLLESDDILQIVVFCGTRLKIISIIRIEVITKEDVDHIGAHKLAPSVATMNVANEVVGHVSV